LSFGESVTRNQLVSDLQPKNVLEHGRIYPHLLKRFQPLGQFGEHHVLHDPTFCIAEAEMALDFSEACDVQTVSQKHIKNKLPSLKLT